MLIEQLFNNKPLCAAALAWFIAQLLKTILTFISEKKLDLSRMYGSGGMPSSHSAFVVALTVSLGLIHGFDSAAFALGFVLSMIVMYDAAGVRRAAGKQARAINMLFSHSGVKIEEQLKELLGHTPSQVVAGAVLGILIGCFFG